MRKIMGLFFILILLLFSFSACSQEETVDEDAANKIKDAIIAAENGDHSDEPNVDTNFFHTDEETYGYRLLTGETALPADETGLRAAIDLINWWCNPADLYGEDAETAYQYVGICLVNNEVECYDVAFGTYEDEIFEWKREFAVNFDATRIFELNVNTLEYVEIYSAS